MGKDDEEPTLSIDATAGSPKRLVTLWPDGRLEFGPEYKPDDAARVFWGSIQANMPIPGARPLVAYTVDELRDEIARRSPN